MNYKTLLVVSDDTADYEARLDVAVDLVERHQAHLVGLFVWSPPRLPTYVQGQLPSAISAQQKQDAQDADGRVQEAFERRAARNGLSAEWRSAAGRTADVVGLHARYADITVCGQANVATAGAYGTAAELPETLALSAGRPVLVVPYAGRFRQIGQRVVVAWDASREATRAIFDALPLLRMAERVVTVSVNPRRGEEAGTHGDVTGADLALVLARHGVKVIAQNSVSRTVSIADVLLNQVADESADLLVMGAYGHSRTREMILGGVTRHLLSHMTVPVLMSH